MKFQDATGMPHGLPAKGCPQDGFYLPGHYSG